MRSALALAALGVVALAGCGEASDGEADRVGDVALAYSKAANEGDGDAACELMTAANIKETETGSHTDCEKTFRLLPGQQIPDPGKYPELEDADANGENGSARIRESNRGRCSYMLEKEDGDWKIALVLCTN